MELVKIYLSRFLLKIFWLIPLKKNYIFFSSYEGKQFSCNPKALFQYIRENAPSKYCLIYEYNDDSLPTELKKDVIVVKHNSLKYIYYIMICKYLITNSGISCCFPLRKKQININTWHGGGAYKKVGFAASEAIHSGSLKGVAISSKQTSYFISSSKKFSDIMSYSLKMDKSIFFEVGMPRNDVFFNRDQCLEIDSDVRKLYNISKDDFIVLYAPTYRGNSGDDEFDSIPFDVESLIRVIKSKFNKNVKILLRLHYFNNRKMELENCLDVSKYPDMQDLLVASNMLITDYSSSMWDYSFTNKPCFLFINDLEKYINNRGLYTSVDEWPGIVCQSEEELYKQIENYNPVNYLNKINEYHKDMGNFEYGNSCEQVFRKIKESLI